MLEGFGYTNDCFSNLDVAECRRRLQDNGSYFYNLTCWNSSEVARLNLLELSKNATLRSPSEEYF